MEIYEIWQNLKFNDSLEVNKNSIENAIKQKSQLPLLQLKERLKYKIYWLLFFVLIFSTIATLAVAYLSHLMLIILVPYVLFMIYALVSYRQLDNIKMEENLTQSLENYYKRFSMVLKVEETGFLFLFPIIAIVGLLFGVYAASGMEWQEFFSDHGNTLFMLAVLIVMMPLSYLVARWMNKVAYGDYLRKIKSQIEALQAIN